MANYEQVLGDARTWEKDGTGVWQPGQQSHDTSTNTSTSQSAPPSISAGDQAAGDLDGTHPTSLSSHAAGPGEDGEDDLLAERMSIAAQASPSPGSISPSTISPTPRSGSPKAADGALLAGIGGSCTETNLHPSRSEAFETPGDKYEAQYIEDKERKTLGMCYQPFQTAETLLQDP